MACTPTISSFNINNTEPSFEFVSYTEIDEATFDQFVENEIRLKGSPPASKAVVESLPVVVASNGEDCVCAVCKDEMVVGDDIRMLPCLHCYHGHCILPWLGMRNSCPVCRFELPTDNLEYEKRRISNTGG